MFKFFGFSHVDTTIQAKEIQVDCVMDLWGSLFSCEGNTLVVTHPKENLNLFFEFLRKYPFNGNIFEKNDSLEDLERTLLHQKALNEADLVSIPYVIVFNQCLNDLYCYGYEQAVVNKDNLSIRTITITSNCKSIPKNILESIDTVLIYGKRKNVMYNKDQLKFLHSRLYKKLTDWSSFIENIVKKVEYKRAILIKDSKVISLTFNKGHVGCRPVELSP